MARELTWAAMTRRDTPTVDQVEWAYERKDDGALMRPLILSNVAVAGHLDRIASAIERQEGA